MAQQLAPPQCGTTVYDRDTVVSGLVSIAVVGAGFSGAVIARELADSGFQVDVFEGRAHVAGNCHTERDSASDILVHRYGPHIFHTDNDSVWQYLQRFSDFLPYSHRVKTTAGGRVFSLPINLHTINQFFGKNLSPDEARDFLRAQATLPIDSSPITFEEQALSLIGADLYEAFLKGYTKKQWGCSPSELPASILKRLPVRFDYDDNYFMHRYQGLPKDGYTAVVSRILEHRNIRTHLNTRFQRGDRSGFLHVFYSGSIDGYFDYSLGRLGYRTLDFKEIRYSGDFQGCSVMNYADEDVPFTRITEHKHFAPWETHKQSVCYAEYSRACGDSDIPYYPIRLVQEQAMLKAYVELASREIGTSFIGRLGTYRYLDMDATVAEALQAAQTFISLQHKNAPIPAFFVSPL
jgi:UDP-galactopyranose mutase